MIPPGYKQFGPTHLGEAMEKAEEQEQETRAAKARREQAIGRVKSMYRKPMKDFGPAQWAMVDAVERQLSGGSTTTATDRVHTPPGMSPATGRFQIDMGARRR